MHHQRVLFWAAVWLVSGCGAGAASPPLTAAKVPLPLTAAELTGVWVEYWAPGVTVDTERYQFQGDGRFAWDAPHKAATGRGPIRKRGAYRLEPAAAATELVLSVQAEDFAGCASCGAEAGGARHVDHVQPFVERYQLGECAPNAEAEARDVRYACLAIAGRAFWQKPPSAATTASLELTPRAALPGTSSRRRRAAER